MGLLISPVRPEDVDLLIGKVEYPAQKDGPLHLLMFPQPKGQEEQLDQREDKIKWMIDELCQRWHNNQVWRRAGDKGGKRKHLVSPPPSLDVTAWLNVSKLLREERHRVLQSYQSDSIYCMSTTNFDVKTWACWHLLGITFMTVDPDYQQQGVGSMLMNMFCHYADGNELDAFVMSSPAGVRLYSKFGFEVVDAVETEQGTFTSMLRTSS